VAALAALALAGSTLADEAPALAPAAPPPRAPQAVEVDWTVDGAITGGALVVWLGTELMKDELAPSSCRWCAVNGLDGDVRDAVVWSDPKQAKTVSDLLVLGVPLGVAAYDSVVMGGVRRALPDVLIIGEAVAVAGALGQLTKFMAARQRPYALYGTLPSEGVDDHLSFYSAHTTVAFSAAAAGGMLAQLRGDEHWPWVYGVGFTAAAATGYFRMAADKHWLTDVLVGAATGTAVGLAVPWLHRRQDGPPPVTVAVAPGWVGVNGRF
jgi:membrane-associated phospholipid phosphatase